jgi:hypothetical protein
MAQTITLPLDRQYFYSSSELELESASSSPLLSVEAGGSCGSGAGGGDGGGAKVSFNVGTGKEVGNIDLRSRSDLASLEYFSVFSVYVFIYQRYYRSTTSLRPKRKIRQME